MVQSTKHLFRGRGTKRKGEGGRKVGREKEKATEKEGEIENEKRKKRKKKKKNELDYDSSQSCDTIIIEEEPEPDIASQLESFNLLPPLERTYATAGMKMKDIK